MPSDSSPTNDHVSNVSCPHCHEVQSSDNVRCARCGVSLETAEQRKARLAALEQSRRSAERESVAIQRLPGFGRGAQQGTNFGSRQFFAEMSNQLRRRYVILTVIILVAFVLTILYGH